ncbi:MAG: histidinol-phosphate transaminase, partial [Gammaproteobacteria bacterium]|nr:histidinol-phosphate transaminase [Gammaproteobacteria bacterium]
MATNVNARIAGLQPYQPGKPVEELMRERGVADAVKLASNENPRGPGPLVQKAMAQADLSRYPDGTGFRLKAALTEHLGVDTPCITLGNGSNDVLDLSARVALSPGTRGVIDQHCFVVYPLAITAANGDVARVPSREWGHDLDALAAAVDERTRIVYLANPNNPTGTWFDDAMLDAFLAAVPRDVWVVLDEAYAEYVDEPSYPDGIRFIERHPNLIVTRTFSKVHALAALRIGYSVSSPEFADLLNRVRQPFNANSLALAAAEAALADTEHVAESRRLNSEGMARLAEGFTALSLEWIPSAGNFVTVRLGPNHDAARVYDALLDDGVIVRPVANYGMP